MTGIMRKVNGVLERKDDDGVWRPVGNNAGAQEVLDEIDGLARGDSHAENQESQTGTPPAVGESDSSRDELDIGDVPGLLSDESPKSTSGKARLQTLRQRAKSRQNGSSVVARGRKPRTVVVPATQVEVSGPDAGGSRLQRGPGRRSVPVKEAPSLLEDRPAWVRDLFEAHFRSELAYRLRHLPSGKNGTNRMKLSRADYAIGWLVMFDKAREDPGILRTK